MRNFYRIKEASFLLLRNKAASKTASLKRSATPGLASIPKRTVHIKTEPPYKPPAPLLASLIPPATRTPPTAPTMVSLPGMQHEIQYLPGATTRDIPTLEAELQVAAKFHAQRKAQLAEANAKLAEQDYLHKLAALNSAKQATPAPPEPVATAQRKLAEIERAKQLATRPEAAELAPSLHAMQPCTTTSSTLASTADTAVTTAPIVAVKQTDSTNNLSTPTPGSTNILSIPTSVTKANTTPAPTGHVSAEHPPRHGRRTGTLPQNLRNLCAYGHQPPLLHEWPLQTTRY